MNVFLWHVHGSWTTAFVQGPHRYFVPVVPGRGPDGRGRAQTWTWPASVTEVAIDAAQDLPVDVVVLQRPDELHFLARQWLGGREPGRDLPAVYVEHNAPQGEIEAMHHPAAGWPGVHLVHVTHFNAVFWDTGCSPVTVIEHGIVDPGYRYTGELPHAAVVVNEPARRNRVVGSDLLPRFRAVAPLDVFGMKSEVLGGHGDLPQSQLHDALARRRVYVHPNRWTSLGLSLLEAMHLGMPVVALGTTAAPETVPSVAGTVSTRVDDLVDAVRGYVTDRELAHAHGLAARAAALRDHGLDRFLRDWDRLLEEVV